MLRRLASVLFALGLLRVLWAESTVEAQTYPWSTKTPTRTPRPATPTPRPPAPPPTPTYYIPTPTPPPPPGAHRVTLQIGSYVVGAETDLDVAKYEVFTAGQWYTLTPRAGTCWAPCPGLGYDAIFRVTVRGGQVIEQRLARQPSVLLARN